MILGVKLLSLFLLSAAGGPAYLPKQNFVPEPLDSQKENTEVDTNHGNDVETIPSSLVPIGNTEFLEEMANVNVELSNETALCVPPCKSADNRIRKKRFIGAVINIASYTLTAVSVVCTAVKHGRKHLPILTDKWRLDQIEQFKEESDFYSLELKKIIKRIPLKRAELNKIKTNIKTAFDVFEYSRTKADAVADHYKKLIKGIQVYKDLKGIKNIKEALQNITLHSAAINKTYRGIPEARILRVEETPTWLVVLDVSEDVGYIFGDVVDHLWGDTMADWAASEINKMLPSIGKELASSIFTGAMDIFSIAMKITKIVQCIKKQIAMTENMEEMYRQTSEHRDNMKKSYDNAKIAMRDLDAIQKKLEETESMFIAEIDKLVVFTNKFFEALGNPCRTNPGTLNTDISELWNLVKYLKDEFDLKVTMEKEKESVDKMKAFLPEAYFDNYLQMQSSVTLDKLRITFATVEVDDLVNKMKKFGFSFPNERWSEWTPIQANLTCSCAEKSHNATCLMEEIRTCLGVCVGPTKRATNICTPKLEDKFHFFSKCKSRDSSFRGKCIIANTNKTRDNGGVLGRYVNTQVSQIHCYEDCKKIGGAHGCEFIQTSCHLNMCTGDCFVINEEIEQGDNFTMATCYKFKTVQDKTESLLLKSLLDALQKTMTGKMQYDGHDFDNLMWAMLDIDKNLLQSQENGWKEIIEYQNFGNDSWGGNPSSYQERNRTTLILSGIPSHNISLDVVEPCNFASNIGYYHLMSSVTSLKSMNSTTKKGLGQATAGLALSSSFFHGSNTRLGQNLDNLMIKIIVYILHQSYMGVLDIPVESAPMLTQLTSAGSRGKSGAEIAQFMTDLFEKFPSSEWSDQIATIDIPDYEVSGSALILTLITNLGYTGPLVDTGCRALMTMLGVNKTDRDFLIGEFLPEMKTQLDAKNMTWIQKPDFQNTITALLRMSLSFPYQETFNSVAI